MILDPDREKACQLIQEAVQSGARQSKACACVGISERTYQRWVKSGSVIFDGRPTAQRQPPGNKLSEAERSAILAVCHEPEFSSLPPSQIVPRLADEGRYLASESSFYRVLHDASEQHHRGRAQAPSTPRPAPSHCAMAPCEVWSWDITWLRGPVRGMFFYLYMIVDLYSRKIVGWEVHDRELADHASTLIRRAMLAEGCIGNPLVLHADNGSPQKGSTMKATLEALGIMASYSRPRVSDDNAYSESLFRTCKYRPDYPQGGFTDIVAARQWVYRFVQWYNFEHRHSAIKFVTPYQRHCGLDHAILSQRQTVYEQAKQRRPERWSGTTRNWDPIAEVWLNPPAKSDIKDQQAAA